MKTFSITGTQPLTRNVCRELYASGFCNIVGGVLSPLLSNIVLDELDRKLEERGHRFVRYADDCNIYVRSERAAQRVLESTTRFIEKRMRLKVNQDKSAADRATNRQFLGFSYY